MVDKYYYINMRELEKNIITNMCLIYKNDEILVQLRTKSDWPGITFPGGHVEKDENFDESIKREVKEETGLILNSVKLCGIEEFKHIQGEDRHIILLYKSNDFSGEIKQNKNEDKIFWIKRKDLFNYELSTDLDIMLKVIEDETISELIYYKDGDEYKTMFK